ncbi:hypothetical protein ACSD1S_004360 [Escherichia coli]|uniref:hypothetical protein n=1 Tax=Enterobacter cloacae complex TaxID=354276 RepID=UPI0005F960A8|nr:MULTISPECIES: hypothetical protein [Enterobacter cloacae complex]EJD5900264.1 hypothetical protein [Escherichia coli]KJX44027.1 hypothetical protein SG79_18185 [Enterobacter hormaechei subsp. xiangfangensis]HCU0607894.1 hypothetical protein [Enterobacter kobei]
MADPAWLGYGGLTASALSAVAAYLAIRQTVIQRKLSNKAQIITKDVKIKLDKTKIERNIAFNALSRNYTPFLPVLNVGLGPALKFKYKWIFDYEKHLKLNGIRKLDNEHNYLTNDYKTAISANEYCYQFEVQGHSYISILGFGESQWYSQEEEYTDIVYILPWSVNKEEVNLRIPMLIPMLLSNYLLDKTRSHEDMLTTIDGPELTIEYEEISGTTKKEYFSSKYQINRYTIRGDTVEATFTLTFSHGLSRTALVLQRVRERYKTLRKKFK